MGLTQVIDLIPLIQGDLVNNRCELHELLVRSSLSTKKENTIINVEEIKNDIVKSFKFKDFPNELLTNILEDFEKANYLKSVERGKYEILKKEFKEFDPYIHKKGDFYKNQIETFNQREFCIT